MSEGGRYADAGQPPVQVGDPLEISRMTVAEWLRRVEGARDAMMRSGLTGGEDATELCLACEDLRASWAKFEECIDLLLTRVGHDPLVTAPLMGMIAMYLQGIGAAGLASKYYGLPTVSDLRTLRRGEMKLRRAKKAAKPEGQLAKAARDIALDLARPLWTNDRDTAGKFRYRRKFTAVADRIYTDFCRRMQGTAPPDSHWAPPEGDGEGEPFERYRAKMLNPIRWAYREWEKARPPGAV